MQLKTAEQLGVSSASDSGHDQIKKAGTLRLAGYVTMAGALPLLALGGFGGLAIPALREGIVPMVLVGMGILDLAIGAGLLVYASGLASTAR